MNCERIREALNKNRIPFEESLPEKLEKYLRLLLEWNSRMDLTAVCDEEDIPDRHFIDSLSVLRTDLLQADSTVIDVGTGAGFPGMVLAIARPDLKITLLDSLKKRLNFLEAVQNAVGAGNTELVHARAEDGARDSRYREHYDYAIARGVAPLNVLCEYLIPYVRIGGSALCWKGPALPEETEAGRRAAGLLGGRLEDPVICWVEGRDWDHRILPVVKIERTPSVYPRKAGLPKTKPLGVKSAHNFPAK